MPGRCSPCTKSPIIKMRGSKICVSEKTALVFVDQGVKIQLEVYRCQTALKRCALNKTPLLQVKWIWLENGTWAIFSMLRNGPAIHAIDYKNLPVLKASSCDKCQNNLGLNNRCVGSGLTVCIESERGDFETDGTYCVRPIYYFLLFFFKSILFIKSL